MTSWRLIINPKGEQNECFGLYLERILVGAENNRLLSWSSPFEPQIYSHSNGAQLEVGNKHLPRNCEWSKLVELDAIKWKLYYEQAQQVQRRGPVETEEEK